MRGSDGDSQGASLIPVTLTVLDEHVKAQPPDFQGSLRTRNEGDGAGLICIEVAIPVPDFGGYGAVGFAHGILF